MSTLVVYSGTGDGYLDAGDTAGTGVSVNTTSTVLCMGDLQYVAESGYWDYCNNAPPEPMDCFIVTSPGQNAEHVISYTAFDTSTVGSGSSVSSAVLSITPNATWYSIQVEARSYDFGSSLDTGDWLTPTAFSACTLRSHLIYAGAGGTRTDMTDDAMASGIVKTGSTRLTLSTSYYAQGGVGDKLLYAYSADQSGTTLDPMMTVTYSAGAGTPSAGMHKERIVRRGWAG